MSDLAYFVLIFQPPNRSGQLWRYNIQHICYLNVQSQYLLTWMTPLQSPYHLGGRRCNPCPSS